MDESESQRYKQPENNHFCSKRKRDRYTILQERLLTKLKQYYRLSRPKEWLFTITDQKTGYLWIWSQDFFVQKKKAGLGKEGRLHTSRHCFATYLL